MAIATSTAILIGLGVATAGSQVASGRAKAKASKQEGEFNAQVYEQQAEMVKQKQKIQEYQFDREGARMRGAIISQTAGKGLLMSGSPMAILADSESQLEFDRAIGRYNSQVEENYARSGADYQRTSGSNQARLAKAEGYSNAFSTLLSTGSSVSGMRTGSVPKKGFNTIGGNSIASSNRAPANYYARRA